MMGTTEGRSATSDRIAAWVRAGAGALLLAAWVSSAAAAVPGAGNKDPHPLKPPDISSPRATLHTFLAEVRAATDAYHTGDLELMRSHSDRAFQALSLEFPPTEAGFLQAVETSLYLLEVLIRVDPEHLDQALCAWNAQFAAADEGLAIDGKTLCNAIDGEGRQTHVLGVVGHQTRRCHTQKKSAPCP